MKKIGRYEIVGRLGRGGMAAVYKAQAPITGRLVALKVLQPRNEIFVELVGEARLKEIFVEEARVMGSISHSHVAKVLDCDEEAGLPFIVLEYFGHSIGALIGEAYRVETPSRIISMDRTKKYLLQALRGLERLHLAGIIHRDIKPYNLMITDDDRVKIIDFGLSRVRGEEKMAIPGMQVGSPYYAAPEQERDPRKVDGRGDLYSLGVLAYRMLTGELYSHANPAPQPPSSLNPMVAPAWDGWVLQSLAAEPAARFADAQKMRWELENLPVSINSGGEHHAWQLPELPLRKDGERVMLKDIDTLLALDSLHRPRWYARQNFRVEGRTIACERFSGLCWQRHGAGFPLDWHQAKDYVASLNRQGWQGHDDWRLPTVAELRAILSPPLHMSPHSAWPLFGGDIHWLWSSDPCNKRQAWVADVVESYFDRLDQDSLASVCAVCASR
jgi:serine/threonine protein kinase